MDGRGGGGWREGSGGSLRQPKRGTERLEAQAERER